MVGLDRSTNYQYVQVEQEFLCPKALLHTLFHILGRYHEHERADREKYINIVKQNIIEGIIIMYASTYIIHNVYAFIIYVFTLKNNWRNSKINSF